MIRHTPARTDDVTGLEVGLDSRPIRLERPVDETDHRRGPLDAPAQLVEYGDYQCPYCAEALPDVNQVLSLFGNRLLFAFRHFPLVPACERLAGCSGGRGGRSAAAILGDA